MEKSEHKREAITKILGWAPVRLVPQIFGQSVTEAEPAIIRWQQQREGADLDEAIRQGICNHPQFDASAMDFRLDALDRCRAAFYFRSGKSRDETDPDSAEDYFQKALALAKQTNSEPGPKNRRQVFIV